MHSYYRQAVNHIENKLTRELTRRDCRLPEVDKCAMIDEKGNFLYSREQLKNFFDSSSDEELDNFIEKKYKNNH